MFIRILLLTILQGSVTAFAGVQVHLVPSSSSFGFNLYCVIALLVCAAVLISTLVRDIQRYRRGSIKVSGIIVDILWTTIPFLIITIMTLALGIPVR
jgi:hypothetical protein